MRLAFAPTAILLSDLAWLGLAPASAIAWRDVASRWPPWALQSPRPDLRQRNSTFLRCKTVWRTAFSTNSESDSPCSRTPATSILNSGATRTGGMVAPSGGTTNGAGQRKSAAWVKSVSSRTRDKRLQQAFIDPQLRAPVCWYSRQRTVIMKRDAAVAQWIEYRPPKPRAVGSIPASRTKRSFSSMS